MHLVIDAVGAKHSGAATVARNVVAAAATHSRITRVTVFASPSPLRRFAFPEAPRLAVVERSDAEADPLGRVVWHLRSAARAAVAEGGNAILFLSGGGLPAAGLPGVSFIQQSLPFSPEAIARFGLGGRARIAAIRINMALSCRHCAGILVQTPTMGRWVSDAFGLPSSRIRAILPSAEFTAAAAIDSPSLAAMAEVPADRRLLYVGNDSPYKNLGLLFKAFQQLRERLPEARLFMAIPAGHRLSPRPGVEFLPQLGPQELRAAYEAATLLVMPSLVETVGLPMLEASAVGTPVLAADRPYAHDVCADSAEYYDPLSAESFLERALYLLQDVGRRQLLSLAGRRRAEWLTAQRPYETMIDFVVDVAGR